MSEDLELDGEVVPARCTDYYRHPYRHYAQVYGYNPESGVRTIKRFVASGKKVRPADLPPLDEPGEMPRWWRRHFPKTEVPSGIRRAASEAVAAAAAQVPGDEMPRVESPAAGTDGGAGGAVAGGSVVVGGVPASVAPAVPVAPAVAVGVEVLDFPGQVRALREMTAGHHAQVRAISAEVEPAGMVDVVDRAEWARAKAERLEAAQRTLKSSMDILRKAENDLVEWERSRDLLMPAADAAGEVARIVGAIHSGVKRLPFSERLGLSPEQRKVLTEEIRSCFRVLSQSRFGTSLPADIPAPMAASPV